MLTNVEVVKVVEVRVRLSQGFIKFDQPSSSYPLPVFPCYPPDWLPARTRGAS